MTLPRRLLLLMAVTLMVVAMMSASPALAAPLNIPPGKSGLQERQGNPGTSLEHRDEASFKENYGQCHNDPLLEDSELRELSPNPNDAGEAVCRTAGKHRDTSTAPAPRGRGTPTTIGIVPGYLCGIGVRISICGNRESTTTVTQTNN